jgi:hypothetical protein
LNKVKRMTLFFLLLAMPVFLVPAQTSSTTGTNSTTSSYFDLSDSPQWVKDLRRWEIVAFGTIPFAMFTATFWMDMYRWNKANGIDFSDAGRRYAPWPMKSTGAIAMEPGEIERTLIIAASLCITVAFADLIITQIKRAKERKRVEALPHNTTTINRRPLQEDTLMTQEAAQETPPPETKDNADGGQETPQPAASSP